MVERWGEELWRDGVRDGGRNGVRNGGEMG